MSVPDTINREEHDNLEGYEKPSWSDRGTSRPTARISAIALLCVTGPGFMT
jgi:hypothetical protein